MERNLYGKLVDWKKGQGRKPLILRGARQVGKTWLLKEFGRKEYAACLYFNFEEDPRLRSFFHGTLDPGRVIKDLSAYSGAAIRPGETLIVFDEIQASNEALNSLKYFQESAPEIHVAAAGSLLGIRLSGTRSFPVGKVSFLDLHPLTFLEFLDAHGESALARRILEPEGFEPFPDAIHERLIERLRLYFFTGGMPEAVAHHAEHRSLEGARRIQDEILRAYPYDFAKHANASDIPKLSLVWESIPAQLARENKKFMFSVVRPSARAREYEDAIAWLSEAGLLLRSFQVSAPKIPLSAYALPGTFKVYALDVGLLGAMSRLPPAAVIEGSSVFEEHRGAFTENFVAQELVARRGERLYYWSTGSNAEVDFLCEDEGVLHPLEVKAGQNPRSRSLSTFGARHPGCPLSRATLLNLKSDGRIRNYPLYALARFPSPERPAAPPAGATLPPPPVP
ncbi:MAG: ATP-binding protein [Planctomycetota bacterium]